MTRTAALVVAVLAVLVLLPASAAGAGGRGAPGKSGEPWHVAELIRASLFDARSALLLDGRSDERSLQRAERALGGRFERRLQADAPADLKRLRTALGAARRALAGADPVALAGAYGTAVAALRTGAYATTIAAAAAGDAERAQSWLLIRDFRQATRFTRPGVDATAALQRLAAGEIEPAAAVMQVRKDLLDAYQARTVEQLDEAATESERSYLPAVAESTAIAAGYWRLLAPEYGEQRGAAARRRADSAFAALPGLARDPERLPAAIERADGLLDHFTAAPFTPAEQARRAQQLIRFLDLIPVEYDHGVSGTRVTTPFEITEAIAFADAAASALGDLSPELERSDPRRLAELEAIVGELAGYLDDANEGGEVVPLETIEEAHDRARSTIDASFPEAWRQSTDDADYDLVQISLDQMEAAIAAGEPQTAEQARLTAYAFFEFGPEIKLRAFDPGLATEIEGLMWYGAQGHDGLAGQIAGEAGAREVRETRLALNDSLTAARAKTGEGESAGTVITNAGLIVFREGLEAILIIAAITASMIGTKRELRKPILRGALLALPASALLYVAAVLLLDSLSQYGEKLEAVVGLIAIGVLLLVLNWFFHKVYWTAWIAGHRKRGKELLAEGAGAAVGTVAGLYVLGFTSVFREGFETVLFLQALQLSSGTGIVLAGVGAGLLGVAAVGALTFALERKLPYKRLLIVTGVLISLVLVVLVGNTVRTLQGVGWLGITPIDADFPLWMGTWLGVFPTVESLLAQAAAFAFVIGSYYAAEWMRKRHVRVRLREQAASGVSAPATVSAASGAADPPDPGTAGPLAARRSGRHRERRAGPAPQREG